MTSQASSPDLGRSSELLTWALVIAASVRVVSLGLYPLSDTTESRYAEIARKMVESNDWVTLWYDHGVPFWAKPPLSTWVTAASIKVFGSNEFAVRLPHFLGALLVIWLVWGWVRGRSSREAVLAVALLFGASVFFISAGAVMTDMALLVGLTLAMRGFWAGVCNADEGLGAGRWMLFVGLGIGMLAKGPIAIVLAAMPIIAWVAIARRALSTWHRLPWLRGSVLAFSIAVPWYLLAEQRTPGFLSYFLVGEHWDRFTVSGWAGDRYGTAHARPRGSIWLFAFLASLPWAVLLPLLAVGRLKRSADHSADGEERARTTYLVLWAVTPCVFFTASGNVLPTYVLPAMPALAMLAASWLAVDARARRVDNMLAGGLLLMSVTLGVTVGVQQYLGGWKTTRELVREYDALKLDGEPLVFLETRPYSAEFYSGGRAERAIGVSSLTQQMADAPIWLALSDSQYRDLPAKVSGQLRRRGHFGGYDLFSVDLPSGPRGRPPVTRGLP